MPRTQPFARRLPATAARLFLYGVVPIVGPIIGLLLLCFVAPCGAAEPEPAKSEHAEPVRVGVVGCDTSHAVRFTQILNAPDATGDLARLKVTVAYPVGSPDLPSSRDRIGKFTDQLRGMSVEIVDSIDKLLDEVDVVLLESVDGRAHLPQARAVFAAGKPVFIDKPVAASLRETLEIQRLGQEYHVPWFSSSALRFCPEVAGLANRQDIGETVGCAVYSPCALEPHHPDLFWYGIHGVESLFTILGTDCQQVTRVQTEGTELVVGVWKGGRVGTYRGLRQAKHQYGYTVFGTKGIASASGYGGYEGLVEQIARFFVTGKPPVSADETLRIVAFMEAADESKRRGGEPVMLKEMFEKAEKSSE